MHYLKTFITIIKWVFFGALTWLWKNIPRTKYRWSLFFNALTAVYITWAMLLFPVALSQEKVAPSTNNTKEETIQKQNKTVKGSEEWIKEQWLEAGAKWEEVWAVTQGESGWNSDAWRCNKTGSSNNQRTYALDAGLYQLNSIHNIPLSCAINTVCSTHEAIKMYKEQGWTPWVQAKKLGLIK